MHIFQQFVFRPFQSRSLIARYAVAIVSVLGVLVFRSLLHPLLGSRSPFIIFLVAVLVTAWYGGTMPALLALLLGALLGNILFNPPYFTFKLETTSDAIALLIYLLVGVVIIYQFRVVKRHEDRLTAQIAKQAAVENALRLSEERFRLATEALQGVIYDWDASTDEAYRSPGLLETVGYQPDEITNNRKWWQSLIHPDDSERVQQAYQNTIAQRAPTHSVEYRVKHKNGHYLWVWDNSRVIYNAQGQPIRLIGTTLSIDERKHLSDALAQTEERFRLAFENASDAMSISDQNGIVVAANQAYFQLYGYSAAEVIGQHYAIIYPEEDRPQSLERYRQVFNSQHELPFYDSVVRRKDGAERVVEARVGFIATEGQRTYMLSVIRDLTERKQTEKEIFVRYQLTADLAHAVTVEDVGRLTVEHLINYLGAIAGNVYVYHAGENMIELLYSKADMTPAERALLERFPADSAYPMGDVVKHHKPLLFSSLEERIAAYTQTIQFSHEAPGALMVLPLVVASEVFGVISIMFSGAHTFSESEQVFISSLVFQCAQAIERARLADQARELAIMHERQRLARDLHDNVSQLLFSSAVISEMLPRLWNKQPEKAAQLANQLNLMVRGAMAEMRTLLWELRPESIVQTQLSSLLTQLSYAVRARQETEVSVTLRADNEYILPPDVQVGFYRIVQESVHNVVKHGHASAISILMRQTDEYTALIVMDDGQGFDTKAVGGGFGLRNMQERAAAIGAQLSIKSRIGKGTRMRLLWINPSPSDTEPLKIKNPDATPQA